MASTSTDVPGRGPARDEPASTAVPAPLQEARLQAVPGVLGKIARERADDYADAGRRAVDGAAEAPAATGAGTFAGRVAGRGERFERALRAPGLSVIAEIKRGSPSAGAIADLDPVRTARAYARGGAAALSVLTEPRHFGGSLAHLREVVAADTLPAMRKEFVVHPLQVEEAAAAGAGAVLLIAAVLGPMLPHYLAYAHALGLAALVEVHDDDELDGALTAGARAIGVNNRDLRSLEVDLAVAPRLLARARAAGFEGIGVAESGYTRREDLEPVRDLADAVLVGTALARSDDPAEALRRLLAGGTGS